MLYKFYGKLNLLMINYLSYINLNITEIHTLLEKI